MRAMSVMRFVIFGAVGFGIGGAIGGLLFMFLPELPGLELVGLPLTLLIVGAVGGAALGLALKDWRRVVILALLGALGLFVGVMAALMLGSFFNYPEVPIAAFVGAVVGASLGLAFGDWRTILALAVAGAVGFSVGNLPADFVRFSIPILRQLGEGATPSQEASGEHHWERHSDTSKSVSRPKSEGHESDEPPRDLGARRHPLRCPLLAHKPPRFNSFR